jgi:hypothetical protein
MPKSKMLGHRSSFFAKGLHEQPKPKIQGIEGGGLMAEEKMSLGQALRLLGISPTELEETVKKLKEKLRRSKVTYFELGSATGLSQQQIYRSQGELHRKFGIEIIGERERAGAVAEAERMGRDKARLEELTAQLEQLAEQNEWAKKTIAEYHVAVEMKEIKAGTEEEIQLWRKYDMNKAADTREQVRAIERQIDEIKGRLTPSST